MAIGSVLLLSLVSLEACAAAMAAEAPFVWITEISKGGLWVEVGDGIVGLLQRSPPFFVFVKKLVVRAWGTLRFPGDLRPSEYSEDEAMGAIWKQSVGPLHQLPRINISGEAGWVTGPHSKLPSCVDFRLEKLGPGFGRAKQRK
jgi:hypothetical protein